MTRTRQGRIGLALAAAIIGAWLAIHVGAIFFWPFGTGAVASALSPGGFATAPVALAAVLVLVQTWLSTGLFIVAHDAMHGALAPGRPRLNRLVGTLALALYAGLSYSALLPRHHRHHAHAGGPDDPDFHAGDQRLHAWFGTFFRTYYTHGQIVRITLAALVYTLLLGAPLGNIVLFWAVPALGALAQLFVFGTFLPHRAQDLPFADEHRARSNGSSVVVSLLTCFHFGGYHHEHHLHPGTPWWGLPARRRELRSVKGGTVGAAA